MKNKLLIISCSQRKISTPGMLPAIERYDGPTYRTLRKSREDGGTPNMHILIISAKHGLIGCQKSIEAYDQRMTPARALQLRDATQSILKACLAAVPYDEVFINLGKSYMKTLVGFHWGPLLPLKASGGVGQKTAQMKAWLQRISQAPGEPYAQIH